MAVLAEAISVVVRCDRLLAAFGNDWNTFKGIVPNSTLCADNELVPVGFMAPADVEVFIDTLQQHGLAYLVDGAAHDHHRRRSTARPCGRVRLGRVRPNQPRR